MSSLNLVILYTRWLTLKSNHQVLSKHYLQCLSRICLLGELQIREESVVLIHCPQLRGQTSSQWNYLSHLVQVVHYAFL